MEESSNDEVVETEEKPYAQKILPMIIFAVFFYAIADILLQYIKGVEIDSTLTTCWFSFWGVEIISLATIKVTKTTAKKTINEAVDKLKERLGM